MHMVQEKKITILMLDHEPLMIDRRIILEGQSLVQHGYRVCLATRGDGIKPDHELVRGIEVWRFSDPVDPVDPVDIARRNIRIWTNFPANERLEVAIRNKLSLLPRVLQTLVYGFAWPPMMVVLLRNKSPLKKIFGRAFEPLIYFSMLRPSFFWPYVRILISRLNNLPYKPNGWQVKHFVPHVRMLLTRFKDPLPLSVPEDWQVRLEKFAIDFNPDVVHAHDLPNLSLGKRIATQLGIPLVYDAHELYPLQYFADEGRRNWLLGLEKELIVHVDATITVNRQCVEVLESTYSIKDVVPLTNATESPPDFDPEARPRLWHHRFKLAENVKIMVFQGGINPVRNVDELIQALTKLSDNIHVGFITYAKDVPYYEDMTRRLGVFHRVHYIIEIPWDQVISWLASSDVGIMPYQVTNFNAKISSPNKLYEFAVAGLPIIASSELVNVKSAVDEDGLGLTILLREPDSYVEVIRAMFEHPDGPERFRNNVLKARSRYTWSNEEPKLINLYRKICAPSYRAKSKHTKLGGQ